MTCLTRSSFPQNGARFRFHLVVWDLNPNRKCLIIPMISMPPLLQWACLTRLVIIVAHSVHSCVRLMITLPCKSLRNTFQHHESLLVRMALPSQYQLDLELCPKFMYLNNVQSYFYFFLATSTWSTIVAITVCSPHHQLVSIPCHSHPSLHLSLFVLWSLPLWMGKEEISK